MSFSAAQDVARRVAAVVSGRLGEPLWLRDYPITTEGDVGVVVIGLARGTLHRAVAVVHDLGVVRSAVVEFPSTSPATGAELRGFQLGGDTREATFGEAITAAVTGRSEPWPLGLLDAGYGVLDALGQRLGVIDSRWLLSIWGEWDPARGSGISIELAGAHAWANLIQVTPVPGGVSIRIPAAQMGGAEHLHRLGSPGQLVDALGDLIDQVRGAVDGRARFRARPDGIIAFAGRLVEAIRSAHALHGNLRVTSSEGAGFPLTWPSASIDHGGHSFVHLRESGAGITVTVDSPRGPFASYDALAPALPELLVELEAAGRRLRPDQLIPTRTYEVIAPIVATQMRIEAGTRLLFVGVDYVPREGFAIYRFTAAGEGPLRLELCDYLDTDIEILRRLHEFLAPR